jgi:hypothetical protein
MFQERKRIIPTKAIPNTLAQAVMLSIRMWGIPHSNLGWNWGLPSLCSVFPKTYRNSASKQATAAAFRTRYIAVQVFLVLTATSGISPRKISFNFVHAPVSRRGLYSLSLAKHPIYSNYSEILMTYLIFFFLRTTAHARPRPPYCWGP